jgi:Putative lumazine-binding
MSSDLANIQLVLNDYFEGLHHSDTKLLAKVFHPSALYATVSEGPLLCLNMATYFPIVDKRPSPASRNERRNDRIISIEFAGPVTALARAECSIGPKHFIDLITMIKVDDRWQIIAKVFHFDLKP